MKIDATPFFWELIHQIGTLPYDVLQTTHGYMLLQYYMEEEYTFSLSIEDHTLDFQNVNDLFYQTAAFCHIHHCNSIYDKMMIAALTKIDQYLQVEEDIDDLADVFRNL